MFWTKLILSNYNKWFELDLDTMEIYNFDKCKFYEEESILIRFLTASRRRVEVLQDIIWRKRASEKLPEHYM
jgi:hypothetical protein